MKTLIMIRRTLQEIGFSKSGRCLIILLTSQELYMPSRNNQLLLFYFKRYIPKQKAKFRNKIYTLCDEEGYVHNTEVYAKGKSKRVEDELSKSLGVTGSVVLRLMEPLQITFTLELHFTNTTRKGYPSVRSLKKR